jgi:HlyD family secretion protein
MARAQVPESAAGGIRSGESCSFESTDSGAANAAGRVTMINKAVDPARRTVEVWCEIPNGTGSLRGGVFGNLTIVTGNSGNAVVVPLSAVQFTAGTQKGVVFTVDEKHLAHKKDVETGEVADGKVQIRQGLNAGETVIIEGAYGLADGTEVKPQEASK